MFDNSRTGARTRERAPSKVQANNYPARPGKCKRPPGSLSQIYRQSRVNLISTTRAVTNLERWAQSDATALR